MFRSGTAVISVPPHELRRADLPGSLFAADQLQQMPISEALQRAVALVAGQRQPPMCLVRPEIFNYGHAREWLNARLNGTRSHVCLSDGTSVKVIEGLDNHVFFYGLGQRRGYDGLQNLSRWAPEVFSHLKSQINSFHAVELNGRLLQPPTRLAFPPTRVNAVLPQMYRYVFNPQCAEECAELMVQTGTPLELRPADFEEVIYIPLSESGSHDAAFSRLAAQSIANAYFDPARCVLLRLPAANEQLPDLVARILRTLQAIGASGIATPRVIAKNVYLLGSDLPESFIDRHDRWSFLVDDTFDFWRYTRRLYPRLHSLRYLYGGDPRLLQSVVRGLSTVLGRSPRTSADLSSSSSSLLTWMQGHAAVARKR